MKLQKNLLPFLFLAAASLCVGCSHPHYGVAKIDSSPQGAEIINLKDDSHLGSTPARVLFTDAKKTSKKITVQFIKPGYKSKITSFNINHRHESQDAANIEAIDVKVELEKE